MKVTMTELTPEDREKARRIREKFEAKRAGSPPTPISKELIDKMTSGIVDPDEAERESRPQKTQG
jgi:hypothetical protein